MLSTDQKKQAIRQFKEQKASLGIYAIRCAVAGRVWVGASRNLDAARNAAWFSLRMGGHRDPALQRDWTTHGEPAFTYEVLEKLDEDIPDIAVSGQLKDRKQHWMSRLAAPGLL